MHTRGDDGGQSRDRAPAPSAPPSAPEIGYGHAQFYVTKRQWRVLVALTLFNTIALAWFAFGPNSSQFIQAQWQQWQAKRAERAALRQVVADQRPCLDFVMPQQPQLIYEEDPAAALKLTSGDGAYEPVRMRVDNLLATTAPWAAPARRVGVPAEWTTFATKSNNVENGVGHAVDMPVVFLGARTAKGGETRLVVVQFDSRPRLDAGAPSLDLLRMDSTRRLHVSTFRPGTRSQRPRRTESATLNLFLPPTAARVNESGTTWVITRPALMTVFTGQADPNDPSHFTIPYCVNGQPGVIDGWLQPGGPLLKPRSGQAVNFAGSERGWNLAIPPGTRPTGTK